MYFGSTINKGLEISELIAVKVTEGIDDERVEMGCSILVAVL